MLGPFGDGINGVNAATLKRAYERHYKRHVDDRACRWINGALKRLERKETTLEQEVRKIQRHGYRVW